MNKKALLQRIPNFTVPSRFTIARQIQKEMTALETKICEIFANSPNRISICADISTTKSMTLSLLAITGHCWNEKSKELYSIAIDVIEMKKRHNAQYIQQLIDETLNKFKLKTDNMLRIITDSGSNMISAFL